MHTLTRTMRVATWLVAAIVVSMPALAQDPGPAWSYLEAGFNNVDLENLDDIEDIDEIDNLNDDGDGWFAGGVFEVGESFHVFGRFSDAETNDNDLDFTNWFAGGGWHGALGDKADLLGEAAYTDYELGEVSESGWFGRAGIRWRPIKFFEAGGFVRYEDVFEEAETVLEANAMVYIWRIAAGVAWESQDNIEQYNVFARFILGGKQ
jgi:hypothetical protein